jgi:hypothetical protein
MRLFPAAPDEREGGPLNGPPYVKTNTGLYLSGTHLSITDFRNTFWIERDCFVQSLFYAMSLAVYTNKNN